MAAIIRIKRSIGTAAPNVLKTGELSYSYGAGTPNNLGDRLFFGKGDDGTGEATSVVVIGGEYFANMLDHQPGTTTASSALVVDANKKLNEILVNNITITSNSITEAVGDLVLSAAGVISVNNRRISNVDVPSLAADAATKGYVDDQLDSAVAFVTANSGVIPGTYGSSTQVPVLDINDRGQVTSASTATISTTLLTRADSAAGPTGDVSLIDSALGIFAGEGIDVSVTNSNFTISAEDATASNKGVASFNSTNFTVTAGAVVSNQFTIGSTNLNLGGTTTTLAGLTQLDVDDIRIDGNVISSTAGTDLFIDPNPVGDSGDLIIRGNLIVQGTTTTINSVNLSVNDKNITLADSATSAAEADGAGITVNGPAVPATITYNGATDRWNLNKDLDLGDSIGSGVLRFNGVTATEAIEDHFVDNFLLAGEGIDLTYSDATNQLTVSAELATISNAGVASFDSDQFNVTSGAVTIYQLDGGEY
jgi:hypothetical protein